MKRRKLTTLFAVGALAALMLTGCGEDTTVSKTDEASYTVKTTEAVVSTEAETTEAATTEAATAEESATETETVATDYLSENGLAVTPQGSIAEFPVYDRNAQTITMIPAEVSVTTVDNGDGYSDTTFVRTIDYSSLGSDYSISYWQTAFDRYTGYNFETKKNSTDSLTTIGDTDSDSDAYLLEVDGTVYDITFTYTDEQVDDFHSRATIIVHHPTEYNGVVFHVDGFTSAYDVINYDEPFKMLDYDGVVTENSLFFTATDN